jgi:hypothetical protein
MPKRGAVVAAPEGSERPLEAIARFLLQVGPRVWEKGCMTNTTKTTKQVKAAVKRGEYTLFLADNGQALRAATFDELCDSVDAARKDDGAGFITVDGQRCYVR